jgi:hypothetical protein
LVKKEKGEIMALFETIKYKVLIKEKNIELREYDEILLASTKTIINDRRDSGFNSVFNYISGENDQKQKISMTTPVVSYEEEGKLVTGFYVPSKYDQSSVPKPTKDEVFINKFEKSVYAVIRFNGNWTDENFNKNDKSLRKYLEENNYDIVSNRLVLRYQPPFIPGMFRRNEIAYQVKVRK